MHSFLVCFSQNIQKRTKFWFVFKNDFNSNPSNLCNLYYVYNLINLFNLSYMCYLCNMSKLRNLCNMCNMHNLYNLFNLSNPCNLCNCHYRFIVYLTALTSVNISIRQPPIFQFVNISICQYFNLSIFLLP